MRCFRGVDWAVCGCGGCSASEPASERAEGGCTVWVLGIAPPMGVIVGAQYTGNGWLGSRDLFRAMQFLAVLISIFVSYFTGQWTLLPLIKPRGGAIPTAVSRPVFPTVIRGSGCPDRTWVARRSPVSSTSGSRSRLIGFPFRGSGRAQDRPDLLTETASGGCPAGRSLRREAAGGCPDRPVRGPRGRLFAPFAAPGNSRFLSLLIPGAAFFLPSIRRGWAVLTLLAAHPRGFLTGFTTEAKIMNS